MQRVLGLTGYYRQFIDHYSDKAAPLYRMLVADTPWHWGEEQERAYRQLKDEITSAPILAFPDLQREFIVATDASNIAVSGALSQMQPDPSCPGSLVERVIAYGSRALNSAERNYSVTEREYLAMVHWLKHWRPYLHGGHFTVYTDHRAIEYAANSRDPYGRLARFSVFLQDMDYTVRYRPGVQNGNADAITRPPFVSDEREALAVADGTGDDDDDLSHDLEARQQADPVLGPIMDFVRDGTLPADRKLATSTKRLALGSNFILRPDGVLLFQGERDPDTGGFNAPPRVAIPECRREWLLGQLHDRLGHFDGRSTFDRLRKDYWWPGMRTFVMDYCKQCIACQESDRRVGSRYGLLQPLDASSPMQYLAYDVMGPLTETQSGNKFILFAIDVFTNYAFATPLKDQLAKTVACSLESTVLAPWAGWQYLLSDRGKNLMSEELKKLAQRWRMELVFTTAYHHQANPVERFAQTLGHALRTSIGPDQDDWDVQLPQIIFGYNTKVHSTTGFAPVYLMRLSGPPAPVTLGGDPTSQPSHTPATWAEEIRRRHDEALPVARANREKARQYNKEVYDETHQLAPFRVGDIVKLQVEAKQRGKSKKLTRHWEGPYRVVRITRSGPEEDNNINFEIQSLANPDKRQEVHAARLRKYHLGPTAAVRQGMVEVSQILRATRRGKAWRYLVRFQHHTKRRDRWVKASDLDADDLLADFHRRQGLQAAAPRPSTSTPAAAPASEAPAPTASPPTTTTSTRAAAQPAIEPRVTRAGRTVSRPLRFRDDDTT